mmetsp:Transcript_29921/g.29098  ORF Transcript_29921/g.29098 Transcript_29921/m.29098 type:complete len:140 (+) Transcript_29921:1241-1660(+)
MFCYLEEFREKKRKNQKQLTKLFVKQFQEQDGIFSFDEIKNICNSLQQDSFSPICSFPKEVSYSRCFLYALTAGTNGFVISSKDFSEAVSRLGIDNPYPTIQKRINFYGNDLDLEMLLQEVLQSDAALLNFHNLHTPSS